jgi:hypothetical protein
MTNAARGDLPDRLGPAAALFYAHWSPRLLSALALATVSARLIVGSVSLWDLAVAALVVGLWPLQEWLIHVFILHYEPRQVFEKSLDFRVPRLHRAHHREPWRVELVFVPVHVFLTVPLVVALVLALGRPAPGLSLTALALYFALSWHYEWIHFLIHTRYRPSSDRYQRLWRNHRLHHFKNEHYWLGVTMLGGDRLLGTAVDPIAVPMSPTARQIARSRPSQ